MGALFEALAAGIGLILYGIFKILWYFKVPIAIIFIPVFTYTLVKLRKKK